MNMGSAFHRTRFLRLSLSLFKPESLRESDVLVSRGQLACPGEDC